VDAFLPVNDAIEFHSDHAAEFARQYEESALFRERLDVWSRVIARYADPARDAIDVGCGTGVLSAVAARHCRAVLGVDPSAEMLARARDHTAGLPVRYRHETIAQLGLDPPPAAGLVICSSVLEYVPDLSGSVRVLASLVDEGGHLIVSMPNPRSLYRKAERIASRLLGRPAYYRHVRNRVPQRHLVAEAGDRGLLLVESVVYGRSRGPVGGTSYAAVFARQS
jgi:2-polyprenyl-6-hydroxyphenyl methylase/3-demethylubiquinone-9 3-methyltransferase